MKKSNLAISYAMIYQSLVPIAREYGYALAVHGSLLTDLDLIAVPWVDEGHVKDHELLLSAIKDHLGRLSIWYEDKEPEIKPGGRLAYKLAITPVGTIDISFTPYP